MPLSRVAGFRRSVPLTLLLGISAALMLAGTGCGRESESLGLGPQLAPLMSVPAGERSKSLEALAQQGSATVKKRARYLLAADLVQQGQGEAALKWLGGLDREYPVLAGEILVLKAKAYALNQQPERATSTWQKILERYPKDAVAAEALYALGETQPERWDEAVEMFPSHPRTIDIADTRTRADRSALPPRLVVAKYGQHVSNYTVYLNRLTSDFQAQLKPEDWQTVAVGYWNRRMFKQAGQAYRRATPSSETAYRAARGLELGDLKLEAIAKYESMIATYPEAPETANALLKLAGLQESPVQALALLKQALTVAETQQQTHKIGQILRAKLRLHQEQGATSDATTVQNQLLQTYGGTAAAAELRWEQAQAAARSQNWEVAQERALQIQAENGDHELAPQATYWAGEWGDRNGDTQSQSQADQHLWSTYPESYFAWRAASRAGWDVGEFDTVGRLQPEFELLWEPFPLPAGSPALQELYQLGQQSAAFDRWQWEFTNRANPTFAEQLTDMLLRLQRGDYFEGIFQFLNLYYRAQEEPEQRDLYQRWRQDPRIWQALFPLVYQRPVTKWSARRDLNPLLVLGLMRQESRFRTDIRSSAGALGLMQVLPSTGEETAEKMGLTNFELTDVDDNINLGTAYLQEMLERYRDQAVFAIASYNAGPGNVDRWIGGRSIDNLDRFMAQIPFPETNYYVRVVLENYWNYLRLYQPKIREQLSQQTAS